MKHSTQLVFDQNLTFTLRLEKYTKPMVSHAQKGCDKWQMNPTSFNAAKGHTDYGESALQCVSTVGCGSA